MVDLSSPNSTVTNGLLEPLNAHENLDVNDNLSAQNKSNSNENLNVSDDLSKNQSFRPFGTPPKPLRSLSMHAYDPATPTPTPIKTRAKSMTTKKVLFCDPPIQEVNQQSSQTATPLKSILKQPSLVGSIGRAKNQNPTNLNPTTIISDIYSCSIDFSKYTNLDEIFDIAMTSLQKNSRKQQLEVYAALNSLLRSRDSSVSTHTLIRHGNALLKYAYRDLQKAENSKNKLDIRVQIQILKVVDYFMYCEDVAITLHATLTKKFLLNGIKALENPDSYKSIVGAYLHIFNYQRLSHALPNDIATRLLLSVSSRPTLSSVGLFSEYIATFRLLIQSHPSVMISHCSDWIPVVLKCIVDENSLLRYQALSVVQDCNQKLLPNHSISNCFRKVFDQSISNEKQQPSSPTTNQSIEEPEVETPQKFIHVFENRLVSLLAIPGEGKTVMNIWSSVLTSLSRWGTEPHDRIEKWKYFGQMLSISKEAFNSDQISSKIAAIQSWKVIINMWSVTSQTDEISSLDRRAAFLLHPLLSLCPDKRPLIVKHVISIYIYLLNSYLQNVGPNNIAMVKFIWLNFVTPFLKVLFANSGLAHDKGIEIFLQLLAPGSKSPQFIKDTNLDVSCLHPICPKFWRLELQIVLEFLAESSKKIAWNDVIQLWDRILAVIRATMKREIQLSDSTMTQVVNCCSFFPRLAEQEISGEKITQAVLHMLERLGIGFFIEGELIESEGVLSSPKQRRKTPISEDLSSLPIMYVSRVIFRSRPDVSVKNDNKFGYLSDYLMTVHEQTGPPKRTMSIFACCLDSIPAENHDVITGAYTVVKDILKRHSKSWNFDALENEFVNLLVNSFKKISQDETMNAWSDLADVILKNSTQYSVFIRRLLYSKPDRDLIAQYIKHIVGRKQDTWLICMFNQNLDCIGEMINYLSIDIEWIERVEVFVSALKRPFENTFISHELKGIYAHGCRQIVSKMIENGKISSDLKTLLPSLYDYQSDSMNMDVNVLLSSYNDILVAGLESYDEEINEITLKYWKMLFSDKVKGPYSRDLVNAIRKKASKTNNLLPKDFPITRTRSKSFILDKIESVDKIIYRSFNRDLIGEYSGEVGLDEGKGITNGVSGVIEETTVEPTIEATVEPTIEETIEETIIDDEIMEISEIPNSVVLIDSDVVEEEVCSSPELPSSPIRMTSSRTLSPKLNQESSPQSNSTVSSPVRSTKSVVSPAFTKSGVSDASTASTTATTSTPNSVKNLFDKITSNSDLDSIDNLSEDTDTPVSSPLSSKTISPEPMSDESNGKRKKRKRKSTGGLETRKRRTEESSSSAIVAEQPSTPVKSTSGYQTPLTPEFSSPPDDANPSAGKLLYNMLKKFENDFQAGDPFADLTAQEKFESETLLMGVLIKARCSQMAAFDTVGQ